MKLNDKNVASFAVCSSPVDKEGYLLKKGDLNKDYQRRWFILKGNLLFYFQKKQDKEPLGVVVLEACSVQISTHSRYSFEISFDGQGTRTYVFGADNDEDLQSWMKAISHSSYEYLRSIVNELQRRVNVLTSSSADVESGDPSSMSLLHVGPHKASPRLPHRSKSEKVHTPSQSQHKFKVKNGILIDIDDAEAPPLPAKKKSMTIHHSTTKQQRSGNKDDPDPVATANALILLDDDDDDADVEDNADTGSQEDAPPVPNKLRTVQSMSSAPPHSSPYMPPRAFNTAAAPLSPVSTMDRTPILDPIPALTISTTPPSPTTTTTDRGSSTTTATSATKPSAEDNDYDELPPAVPPRPQQNGVLNVRPVGHVSSQPHQVSRQVTAPLDPNKSMYEMHTEFTEAMKALRSERNAQS